MNDYGSFRDVVQDKYGRAVAYADVTVYLAGTTTPATIYSTPQGSALANPFTTAANGELVFYAADGSYDVKVSKYGFGVTTSPGITIVSRKQLLYVSAYASLTDAVASIGASEVTLIIDTPATITADTLIPTTMTVQVTRPGTITQTATWALGFNGPLVTELRSIFIGFSSGDVTFGSGSVKEVYPEWWGAKADNTTDSGPAIQYAISSLRYSFGNVKLQHGAYKKSIPITMYQKVSLSGAGMYVTTIENSVININGIDIESNSLFYRGSSISGLTINGKSGDTTNIGISFGEYGHAHGKFSDILINGFGYGIKGTDNVWECTFERIRNTSPIICSFHFVGVDGSNSDNLWSKCYSDNPGGGAASGSGWNFSNAMHKSTMLNCTVGNTSSTDTQATFTDVIGITILGGNVEGVTPASGNAATRFNGTTVADVRGLVYTLINGPGTGYASCVKVENYAMVTVEGCAQSSAPSGNLYSIQIVGGQTARVYHKNNRWISQFDLSGSLSPYQIVSTEGNLIAKSKIITLSGAADSDLITFIPGGYGYAVSLKVIYPVATSADAGIVINIGYPSSTNFIASFTTSPNKAAWSSETINIPSVSASRIGAWPEEPVIVSSPGGKTGAGAILIILEYTISL